MSVSLAWGHSDLLILIKVLSLTFNLFEFQDCVQDESESFGSLSFPKTLCPRLSKNLKVKISFTLKCPEDFA